MGGEWEAGTPGTARRGPGEDGGRGGRGGRGGTEVAPRGTAGLIRLVAFLVRRPRPRDRRLPIVWLGGEGAPAVLRLLRGRLAAPPRGRVPHAWAEAGRPAGELPVLPLLRQLRAALSVQTFGADRLWFPRFGLLTWLLGQDVSGVDSDAVPGELVRRLRQRRRSAGEPAAAHETAGQFGALYHLVWQLLRKAVPAALFRAAVSGRIPGIGRQYRWFMRQHYLAPAQSGTFPAFAERLTAGARQGEDPDQLNRLLVHAFLEDLRRAYARPPWRVRGWRRTACPVALILGGPPGDAGAMLLGLLNDVRNETGRWDPLLAVYATERPAEPPGTGPLTTVGLAGLDSGAAEEEWSEWEAELDRRRQARADRAWFLLVRVERGGGAAQEAAGVPSGITVPGPPWFARRTLAVAVCLVLLAPGAVWAGRWLGGPDCLHAPFSGEVSVRSMGGECVGYSDDSGFKFNDQPGQENLRRVQERIFEQNREARDIWERSGRRRPYVTLVYLGTLTGRSTKPNEEAYAAEREELEGLAVAQYEGVLQTPSAYSTPLVRVVVANAGFQMRYADAAVSMIADLAREGSDAPVVGVIGLVESRRSTAEALERLHRAGLPAIAPTLSADRMGDYSDLYLQLAAPNRDQARLIAAYARREKVRKVRVYYTTGERSSLRDDYYVSTLLDGLGDSLGPLLDGKPRPFRSGGSLRAVCDYQGMLFFAGRWSEFNEFLGSLSRSCVNELPHRLVANDSVNRYMANPELRKSAPGTVSLIYVSKAALSTCGALETRAEEEHDEVAKRFLLSVREEGVLSPPRCRGRGETEDRVGERVGLAYDSARMLLRAVGSLVARVRADEQPWDPRAVNPAGVHAEVLHQNYVNPYYGVTGSTVYDTAGNSEAVGQGEPVGKRISLLKVESIPDASTPPKEVFRCGAVRKGGGTACVPVPG
ncbi:hypothetical protein KBZ10_24310 [Streptomyces sp. F63]|uniref:hypothetical protein n=1 Tax=Streptomyces sp. F63 TaxID=2824887 RepID=UPI001B38B4B5|nr:hypothetical protein [Streptomyces sp. F63]MBQ0987586.1 hypothetical protein [Streptomyces sp. F63]